MNILMVSTTAIGDTVMATPFIRAVRQHFPTSSITVMAHERRIELLSENPHIDRFVVYRGKGKGLFRLLGQLRKGKFDLAIVLHANDPDIVPLVRWTGAPIRCGWGESKWAKWFTHKIYRTQPPEHFLLHKQRLLSTLGIPVTDLHTELFLTAKDRSAYDDRLRPWLEQRRCKPFVVMHTSGSNARKWWPEARFHALSKYFYQARGWLTVFIGDAQSLARLEQSSDFDPQHQYLAKFFSLRQSAAVIDDARFMVTTDSGPMHIAFALRKPTLALFGPTQPSLHGPCFDQHLHQVIHHDPLEELSVDQVISKAETWIKRRGLVGQES